MKLLFTTCLFCLITMLAQAQTVFFESFDNSTTPAGWTNTATTGTGWSFSTSAGYTVAAIPDHTGNGGRYAWVDFSGTDVGVILETPVIDVSTLTTPYLQFYFESHYATPSSVTPYNFMYLEAWDGTTWVNVNTFQGDTGFGWDEYGFNMTPYVYGGSNLRIRFRCESGGSTFDFYNDLLLDDVEVMELPTCPSNSNLAASNITATTVDLSWVENGTATTWEVEYGNPPFAAGTGTRVTTTTRPYTLPGLMPSSTYGVYVRSVCGPNDTSQWTGPVIFNTACAPVMAPWTESFNGTNTPNCWNETGSEPWRYNTFAGYAAGSAGDHTGNNGNYAWIDGSSPSGPNQASSLETPEIDVTSLNVPLLSFWVFSHNPTDNTYNTLDVEVYDGAAWNLVQTINTDQGNAWNLVNIGLQNLTITGPIRARFTVTENSPGTSFYNDILIDDIEVKDAPNVAVTSFIGLQNTYCNTSVNISMVVENRTGNIENDVPWEVYSDGAVIASGMVMTLPANSSDTIMLSLGGVGPAGPNAMITAYTNYGADQTPSDDTLTATVGVSYTGVRANVNAQVGCTGGNNGQITAVGQNGIAPYTYLWSNNQTTGSASGLSAGSYTITVTDDIGCATVATLALADPPALTFSGNSTDLSCNGDNSGSITTNISGGVPGYSYNWSNGSNMAQLNNLSAGNYSVTATDAYGCETTQMFTLTEPTAVVASVVDNANGTATASGSGGTPPYTYQWDPNANNQTTAVATGLISGEVYYVVVTDADGCTGVFSFQASRIVSATAIAGTPSARLYPNPTQGNTYLEWSAPQNSKLNITITAMTGQLVWNQTSNSDQLIELPTAELPSGVYSVQVTDGQTQWMQKLVVGQ